MAYDEQLAARIRALLRGQRGVTEKKMFGGLAYLANGKMFAGVLKTQLVVRVGPEANDEALKNPHTRPMDFTGRPMKGFIYVDPNGVKTEAQLRHWLMRGNTFVATLPRAKQRPLPRVSEPITSARDKERT